jgi:PTS system nitrogen regulatory IIA component
VQLTIREAASYLDVTESTLRRWITQRDLPVHRANERIYLNAVELWEWATEHNVRVSRRLLERARRSPDAFPSLSDLLRRGGIAHDVPGKNKPEVLRSIVRQLPLPEEIDRDFLFSVLEAREAMGSTGIGDGIAVPHVRNPILLQVDVPFVTLCLLQHPVDFDAIDGLPVHALFVVVSPTVPGHLKALAQLGYVLRDAEMRNLLKKRATAEQILARVEELEARGIGASGEFPAASRPKTDE